MDWSRAKTIFILSFLVLDIFLILQIIDQKSASTYDYLSDVPVEEQMAADQITLPELPQGPEEEFYIEANVRDFSMENLANPAKNGQLSQESHELQITLDSPYELGENWHISDVDRFVKNFIDSGSEYRYWDYDKTKNTITYFQQYNGKLFYNNRDARIVLQLNEDQEIVSYSQTMLEDITEIKNQAILSALDAVLILYKNRLLERNDEVIDVELGYYTLVPLKSSQILAPTWRISIAGKDDFFINAVEGHIINEETQILN
ncbi:MAG: two-component system regulatory protein YycI [Caldibacillus sp.]